MPSVLITGGAGFIGCALSRLLLEEGFDVTVVDILHPQVHGRRGIPRQLSPDAKFYPVDVTRSRGWEALTAIGSPDCVVHLAAETGTGQSLSEASRHGEVNVLGTTEMIDAFLRNDVMPRHIVLASSRAVYGEGSWIADGQVFQPGCRSHKDLVAHRWDFLGPNGASAKPLANEASTVPAMPTSVYGATKLAQEHILNAWTSANEVKLSVLRLQNVYGPGQSPSNAYTGIVTLFMRQARAGLELNVFEDGNINRDFVYISDVVSAFAAAIHNPPARTRVVDIGSGTPITILRLAEQIANEFDGPTPRVSGQFRDGDVRSAWADTHIAEQDLKFHPTTSLEHGLASLGEWFDTAPEGAETI